MGVQLSRVCSPALLSAEDEQKREYAYQVGGDCYRQGQAHNACPFDDALRAEAWKRGWEDQKKFWED